MMFDSLFGRFWHNTYIYESLNWCHTSQSNALVVRMRQEWKLRLLIYQFTDLDPMKCKGYASGHILHNKQISIYRSLVEHEQGPPFFSLIQKKKYQRGKLSPADRQMNLRDLINKQQILFSRVVRHFADRVIRMKRKWIYYYYDFLAVLSAHK